MWKIYGCSFFSIYKYKKKLVINKIFLVQTKPRYFCYKNLQKILQLIKALFQSKLEFNNNFFSRKRKYLNEPTKSKKFSDKTRTRSREAKLCARIPVSCSSNWNSPWKDQILFIFLFSVFPICRSCRRFSTFLKLFSMGSVNLLLFRSMGYVMGQKKKKIIRFVEVRLFFFFYSRLGTLNSEF